MRRLLIGSSVALLFALNAAPVQARDWGLEEIVRSQGTWEGFGLGSSTHVRRSQEVTMAGASEPQRQEVELRQTLVALTGDAWTVKSEQKDAEEWKGEEKTVPIRKADKIKVEDAGEGAVTIGETSYPCVKKCVTRPSETGGEEIVFWGHPEKGVLKIEFVAPQKVTLTATELERSVTVGERTLSARVFSAEVEATGVGTLKGTMVMSREVPGGLVRQELEGGEDVHVKVVTELLAFEARPAAD